MRIACLPHPLAVAVGLVVFAAPGPAQLQCSLVSLAGPATTEFASAHDAVRGRTVLFGGVRGGLVRNETWQWDGVTWAQFTGGTAPGPRQRAAMVYDEARARCVLFGGFTAAGLFLNDTWSFDGSSWQQHTAFPAPPARSGAAMAWDRVRQLVVMFGGFVPAGTDVADTWEWNGTAWTQRLPSASPPARGAHRLAFDRGRGRTVLFGGWRTPQSATVGDTWQWDGAAWTTVATTNLPGNRCDQAMVWDETRGRIVMFGGLASFQQPGNVPVTLADFHVLGANGWQPKTVAGLPSSRSYMLGEFDRARGEVVLHGGMTNGAVYNQTFLLDTPQPATMVPYGGGCIGSNGTPALAADALPWLGDWYQVSVSSVPQSTIGFLVLGFSNTLWNGQPVPVDLTAYGLPGCQAWLGPELTNTFVVQNGVGSWGLSICNCPFAAGLAYSLQAVVLDAGVARPVAASLSNALRATIGSW